MPLKYPPPTAMTINKAAIAEATGASAERLLAVAGFTCAAGVAVPWASPGGNADPQRIDPHRQGDVLEFLLAEVADRQIEPRSNLAIGILGEADGAARRRLRAARRC